MGNAQLIMIFAFGKKHVTCDQRNTTFNPKVVRVHAVGSRDEAFSLQAPTSVNCRHCCRRNFKRHSTTRVVDKRATTNTLSLLFFERATKTTTHGVQAAGVPSNEVPPFAFETYYQKRVVTENRQKIRMRATNPLHLLSRIHF